MILYDPFYRRFGIRKADQLLNPPLPKLELLELPKNSILHYVTVSPLEKGPAPDDFLFRNMTRPIQVGHIVENGDDKGTPRLLPALVDTEIRKYHIKNRRFRRMTSLENAQRDPNTLVVFNYGFIAQRYRYMRSFYSEYYKWWNTEAAVWKNIAATAEVSQRQQFLMCKLPPVLPGIGQLNMAMEGFEEMPVTSTALESLDEIALEGITQRTIKVFNTPESLFLLELWKWCGENRKDSLLALVPEKHLDKVNLIFQEAGRWFVMNLGLINRWRAATAEELKSNAEASKKGLDASQFQRRYLRLMMSLAQVRSVGADEVIAKSEGTVEKSAVDPTKPTVVVQKSEVPVVDPVTGAVISKAQVTDLPPEANYDDPHLAEPHDDADAVVAKTQALAQQIEADLAELDAIAQNAAGGKVNEAGEVEVVPIIQEPDTLEGGVMRVCDRLADAGLLTAAEYRRYNTLAGSYRTLPAPDGKTTLDQFITIPQEVLKIEASPSIPDQASIIDKTMLQSSLHVFDQRYIREVMPRDVASMVLNIQNAGIAVTGYEVERVEDVLGTYDAYTVKVTPIEGAASTLRFKLPVLEEDGSYYANGIKYRMRKQRGDLPIRKIAFNQVALTSYYGKTFVSRNEKRVNDYGQWLRNAIMARGLDPADSTVTELHPGDVFDNHFEAPRVYSALAMGFRDFILNPIAYPRALGQMPFAVNFDCSKREALYGKVALELYEKDGSIVFGKSAKDHYLIMDRGGVIYFTLNDNLVPLGTFESLLGLDAEKAPVEFAELKVMGKDIPVGFILGYELGLEKLMKMLQVTPRRVPAGSRTNLAPHEYALVFSDETLIFSRDDTKAALILAGFGEYHRAIRQYSVYEFDKPGVYLNVLEANGPSARYLREIDLLYQMFIDPITRDLLIEMKEPTTFRGLLIRSCELLLTDQHPDELDPAYMRIKGYERMAGAVYSEMVRSIRGHNGRPGRSKLPIDLNPYAVWKNIAQDPSIALVSDINPIQNLKEQEAVTYSGVGGRNSRSMTKRTREYHQNDMGTISESTVDSSDVAINTYTSADPQFTSLRGISKRYRIGETGATALLSTAALVSPGADRDDPKRVNFIGIQHSHGVACAGYTQVPVRTGYEQVLAHRTSDLFALTAKKPGKVIAVSDTGLIVEYEDGEQKGIELGRRFGNAAGLTVPHTVVTEFKEGQKFKEGEVLCYNPNFFEKDILNPKHVVWKAGIMVRTALMESTATLEDSSAITERAAGLLTTQMTKVKTVVVNFTQRIHKLIKVGTAVESEDILCIIEDAVTADSELFDNESLDTLRILSAQTPQAKAKGLVERIEIFYHGETEDMSDSLRAIANASDREMAKRHKAAGRKAYTGSVDEGFRVEGEPLALDTVAIRFYITADVPAGVGDKGVFCNQMKTVFGQVLPNEIRSESGKPIDAIFGQKSIADRIVMSPEVIGTTATLLDVIGKKAVEAYRKG